MKWVQVNCSRLLPAETAVGRKALVRSYKRSWVPVNRIITIIEAGPDEDFGGILIEGAGPFDVDKADIPVLLNAVTEAEEDNGG